MSDDRLLAMLGSLRNERMDRIADQEIRAKLENAWTTRAERRSFTFRTRRFAPVLATVVLFAGLSAATMNAAGDSPLYAIRVAVEDATIPLHWNAEDRAEYVLGLLDQRQSEAARLEAAGNAAAASKVRKIEQDTLRMARAMLPEAPDTDPAPVAAESPSPTPSVAPTATATATPSPVLVPTAPPATFRPAAPTLTPHTPTPQPATPTPVRTPVPTPAPTGSPMLVVANGLVRNADGTPAAGVCVRLFATNAACTVTTGVDGVYRVSFSGRVNQVVTIYFTRQEGTIMWKASSTATVRGNTLQMPDAKLAKF